MGKKIKIIFPVPLNEHTRELIENQIPAEYIRPEFDVEFVGSKRMMSLADSYYDTYIIGYHCDRGRAQGRGRGLRSSLY